MVDLQKLEEEISEVLRNAARYRWLRDSHRLNSDGIDGIDGQIIVADAGGEDILTDEALDRRIDIEMAEEAQARAQRHASGCPCSTCAGIGGVPVTVQVHDSPHVAQLRAAGLMDADGVPEPDLSEQGRNRSAVLGNMMEELTEGGVPFVKALDATLKAFDHPTAPHGVAPTPAPYISDGEMLEICDAEHARGVEVAPVAHDDMLDEVKKLAEQMWRGEPVPGRVLRFGAAVLGLVDAHAAIAEAGNAGVPPTPAEQQDERFTFVLSACRAAQGMASRYGVALQAIAQGEDDAVEIARDALLGKDSGGVKTSKRLSQAVTDARTAFESALFAALHGVRENGNG